MDARAARPLRPRHMVTAIIYRHSNGDETPAPKAAEVRDAEDQVSSVRRPDEERRQGDSRGAPDLPGVLERNRNEQSAPSKPYLAIPAGSRPAGAIATIVRWGEIKAIVDAQIPNDAVIAFMDWDPPHEIKVQKLDAGMAIKNG
jgi:hypothetical protein